MAVLGVMLVTEDRGVYAASGDLEPETFYSPARLDAILFAWEAYRSRAERVGSTTVTASPVQGGGGGDPDRAKRILGDVLGAVRSLGDTKPHLLVNLVIYGKWPMERSEFARDRDWQGYVVRQAGSRLHLSPIAAACMYHASLRRMARHLGWLPADE